MLQKAGSRIFSLLCSVLLFLTFTVSTQAAALNSDVSNKETAADNPERVQDEQAAEIDPVTFRGVEFGELYYTAKGKLQESGINTNNYRVTILNDYDYMERYDYKDDISVAGYDNVSVSVYLGLIKGSDFISAYPFIGATYRFSEYYWGTDTKVEDIFSRMNLIKSDLTEKMRQIYGDDYVETDLTSSPDYPLFRIIWPDLDNGIEIKIVIEASKDSIIFSIRYWSYDVEKQVEEASHTPKAIDNTDKSGL